MTSLPSLLTRERIVDVSLVIASSVGQAVAAAVAAFATRDAFAALHSANGIPVNTLVRLGMAGVLGAVCLYFAQRHSESLGQSYANALRLCFYRQIAGLPKSRHQERRLGALSLRFIGDLSAARLWFGQGLPDVAAAFIVLPATVLIFMALDLSLALAGIVPIGISLILIAGLGWHLEYRHRALRTRRSGLAIDMVERIAISPELDLMGRTNREIRALEERGVHLRKDAVARRARTASLQSILQAGAAVSGLLMMWTASKMTISPAVVAACLAVLALLMVPLLSLATAWDRYCAWRVAKAKALRLLSEATINRAIKRRNMAVQVEMSGRINGLPVAFSFKRAAVTQLKSEHASSVARHIAGLDRSKGCVIHFDGSADQPKTAYIGDVHVGIQGSLRRCATLLCPKRPKDESILATLLAYDLAHLLISDKGLDARIAEGGRNLSTLDTLRLDLVRAELAEVDYRQRVDLGGSLEFRQLSTVMNDMAGGLEEREASRNEQQKKLELMVQHRTLELQKMVNQLERGEKDRKQLMADISHELRTPLTIILGEAEVALRNGHQLKDETSDVLARIGDSAAHTNHK